MQLRRGRWPGWTGLVPVVAALAGLLFATSAATSHGTDLRASRTAQLSEVVLAEQRQVATLSRQEERLRAAVSELTAAAGAGNAVVTALQAQAGALALAAGLQPVSGPAVEVSLNDAPRPLPGQTLPGNPTPDDLVVHQQDVQAVVNALWVGGARGMTIMGQRVVATSAVLCVGNTLLLHGAVYSPPYVITAVGDPAALRAALDGSQDVQIYRQYVAAFRLGYTVSTMRQITLPGYAGPLELSVARAAG